MPKFRRKISLFSFNFFAFTIIFVLFILFFFTVRTLFIKRLNVIDLKNKVLEIKYQFSFLEIYQTKLKYISKEYFKKIPEYDLMNQKIEDLEKLISQLLDYKLINVFGIKQLLIEIQTNLKNYKNLWSITKEKNKLLFSPIEGIVQEKNSIKVGLLSNQIYDNLGLNIYFKKLLEAEKKIKTDPDIDTFLLTFKAINNQLIQLKNEINDPLAFYTFYDKFVKYKDLILKEYELKTNIETNFSLLNTYLFRIKNILEIISNKFQIKIATFYKKYSKRIFGLLIAIFIILALFVIFWYLNIRKPWNYFYEKLKLLEKGDLPDIKIIDINKEYFLASSSLKALSDNLKHKNFIINQFAENNYDVEIKPISENDILANSLDKLKKTLISNKNEVNKILQEQKVNNWISEGLTTIGTVMRQNTDDLNKFIENTLKKLMEYTEAAQGIFFMLKDDDTAKQPYLEMMKAYAYGKERTKKRIIQLYEGLIGTAAVEKKFYFFDKVPENYVFIEDAFGKARPKSLVILPLVVEDKLLGVIELAFQKQLPQFYIDFFKHISTEIAITLSYVKINQQTKELFEHTKQQAQQLTIKEQQYQKNQEQLKQIISELEDKLFKREQEIKKLEEIIDKKVAEKEELKKYYETKIKELENSIDKFIKEKEHLISQINSLSEQLKNLKK